MENKTLYWIWLSLLLGAGCKNSTEIIDVYKCNPYNIYDQELCEEFSDYKILTPTQVDKIKDKSLDEAKGVLDYCEKNGIRIITPDCKDYPKMLLRIPSCPLVLYLRGNLPDFETKISIATVGTRKMTEIGKRCAYEFAYDLSKSGMIITSGMALGIDSTAHRAALDAMGSTIAVLGSGIDNIYPSQNESLYEEICEKGGVITEFAPGTPPFGHNFPIRNRIVSGLSVGTLVIEAGERSGSLNTARHASEQGREVFSVPGRNGEYNNMGSNLLLKNGAIAVTEAEDIVNFYTARYGGQIKFAHITKRRQLHNISIPDIQPVKQPRKEKTKKLPKKEKAKVSADTEAQKKTFIESDYISLGEPMLSILKAIAEAPMAMEDISQALNKSLGEILTAITMLEIQGIIKKNPEGTFSLK